MLGTEDGMHGTKIKLEHALAINTQLIKKLEHTTVKEDVSTQQGWPKFCELLRNTLLAKIAERNFLITSWSLTIVSLIRKTSPHCVYVVLGK